MCGVRNGMKNDNKKDWLLPKFCFILCDFTLLKPNKTRKVKQKHVGQRDFLSCRDVLIFYKGRVKF